MKTIRVFEAFAGYGSQLMALERLQKMFGGLNIQPIGYSEIDPYTNQGLRACSRY